MLGLKTLKPYHVCIHTGSQPHGALALTLLLLLAVLVDLAAAGAAICTRQL